MNFNQIRYARELAQHGFSILATSKALHTSQPGISQRIMELETELGVEIFVRRGRRITGATTRGKVVLEAIERIWHEIENLRRLGGDNIDAEAGTFVIAATHMQARYILPRPVLEFTKRYPRVQLAIRQGNPRQLAEMVIKGEADIAIATETLDRFPELETHPCYRWHHCVIAPLKHPILNIAHPTLHDIAAFPIVTYDAAFTGRTALDDTFHKAGIEMNVVLTAIDTDVIKTYVRSGMGLGIIASVAVDTKHEKDLAVIDGSKLFPERVTKLSWRKGAYVRGFVQEFIQGMTSGASLKHLNVQR